MSTRFDGRVALITGAGKGLGRAYALWMAARGAAVVVNNRVHEGVPSSAQAVVEEIRKAGGKAIADEHAVQEDADARAMVDAAIAAFGRLDILVCNAAISLPNVPFHEVPLARVREVMDINLWGTLYPLHAALPGMLKQGYGRVVLTTSQVGLFGRAGTAPYACSKTAMIGLARSVGWEGHERNIRVNVVAPAAYTTMSQAIGPRFAEVLSPFKVAPVVGWLSSDACDRSGMIFNVGAGRVRRVMLHEGAVVEIPDDDMAACWPALDDMTGAVEAKDSTASGAILIPGRLDPNP